MNLEQKRVAAATDVPWRAESAIPALVGRVEELEAALRDAAEVLRSARAAIEDEQMAHGCVDGKHPAVDEIDAVLGVSPCTRGNDTMRINVYAEELTDDTELVTKTVTDDKFGTRTFYGVRTYLHSPPELHDDPADDDRSAITLWVPWTRADGHNFDQVYRVLLGLTERLNEARKAAEVGGE